MKTIHTFLAAFLLGLTVSNAQETSRNWGLGIRLGDPSGLSLKKYMGNKALEISFGRTYTWYGRGWYNNHFYTWYDGKNYNYSAYEYLGYRATFPVGLQVHYLFQRPISAASSDVGDLEWYYGAGGQLRFHTISYDYRYKVSGDPNWYYVYKSRYTNLDLGLDLALGLEYTFKKVPIAIFTDLNIFMEVVDNPFIFWWQGGLGARYNF